MLEIEELEDVTRVVMSTAITRGAGYTASAFLTRGVLVDLGFPAICGERKKWTDAMKPAGATLPHPHEAPAGTAELAARRPPPLAAAPPPFPPPRASSSIELHRRIIWGT